MFRRGWRFSDHDWITTNPPTLIIQVTALGLFWLYVGQKWISYEFFLIRNGLIISDLYTACAGCGDVPHHPLSPLPSSPPPPKMRNHWNRPCRSGCCGWISSKSSHNCICLLSVLGGDKRWARHRSHWQLSRWQRTAAGEDKRVLQWGIRYLKINK